MVYLRYHLMNGVCKPPPRRDLSQLTFKAHDLVSPRAATGPQTVTMRVDDNRQVLE